MYLFCTRILRYLSLLIALSSLPFFSKAHAQTPEKLRCYSTVFEPYVIDKDGVISGIDVDIIKMAGDELGIDIDFSLMPWARLELELKAGRVDCVAAYFRTPERESYMLYTGIPLHVTSYSLFVPSQIVHAAQVDKKGWRVGVHRGFKTTPEFEKNVVKNDMSVVDLKSTNQAFEMMALNRVDAVLTDLHVGQYLVRENYPGKFAPIKPNFKSTPAYFVFSTRNQFKTLISQFDGVLMEMMVDGRYKKVFDDYAK